MSQIQTGSEANAAALVGSLATFSLFDVLELLARTGHTGELQVVARGIDQRVWIDRGDLLDASGEGSNSNSLFELVCVDDGWFYFTLTGAPPEDLERVPVVSLLADLRPQVEEWRTLVPFLPFDARVSMSATTPGPAVQIRSDQWQLLGLVGSPGRTIRAVIDTAEAHPLTTLRTLRELIDGQLVTMVLAAPTLPSHGSTVGLYADIAATPMTTAPSHMAASGALDTAGPATAGLATAGPATAGLATASSPPQIEEDRQAEVALSALSGPSGPATAETSGVTPAHAPIGATPEAAPIPPPEGWVAHDERVEGPVAASGEGDGVAQDAQPAQDAEPAQVGSPKKSSSIGSAMPPPITDDPWTPTGSSTERTPSDRG
jgi:hypothetical protein